jgi:hypothetical protein
VTFLPLGDFSRNYGINKYGFFIFGLLFLLVLQMDNATGKQIADVKAGNYNIIK